jgi:hypothetical protein
LATAFAIHRHCWRSFKPKANATSKKSNPLLLPSLTPPYVLIAAAFRGQLVVRVMEFIVLKVWVTEDVVGVCFRWGSVYSALHLLLQETKNEMIT